ncbi:hypothetical protein J2S08_000261 [Bacillus chungangensis]|uniref:Uncharacterized protein n=1 Tax=Bacillus chungangensis TaxID=587633 RepID=A0ABT9WMB4_9BACI|nr:hypothetical protein [Bacillus chungangensis]
MFEIIGITSVIFIGLFTVGLATGALKISVDIKRKGDR